MCNLSHLDGKMIDGLSFCSEVYAIFEKVRAKSGGKERLRNRATPTEKLIIEELLPACKYLQTYYRAGRYISIRWIAGSQSYDAELHQEGDYINHGYYPAKAFLEITSAMHKNEHWTWKLGGGFAPEGIIKPKNGKVISKPVVFTNYEHVENFIPLVLNQIVKKSNIPYPENTSLVVNCYLNSLYTIDDWELLVQKTKESLPPHSFREIIIYDSVTDRTSKLV